ncbi:MAG TPA: histidine phosphatase family protein [Lachnospiraceae bacterium]|nr:histidine phosphatase family protein [Lachnospiraceae bacterium]
MNVMPPCSASDIATPAVNEGKDILIVGHGAMNSAIICQIKKLEISEFWSNGIEQCKLLRLM